MLFFLHDAFKLCKRTQSEICLFSILVTFVNFMTLGAQHMNGGLLLNPELRKDTPHQELYTQFYFVGPTQLCLKFYVSI